MPSNIHKIVFFYRKKQTISGSLLMYFNLAKYIAENNSDYEVYYINYYNEYINNLIKNTPVIFRDYQGCSCEDLEDAVFIVPLNYIQILLEKVHFLKNSKILLIDWQPYLINYLIAQFDKKKYNVNDLLHLIKETNSLCFMDKSCRLSVNRRAEVIFGPNYVPVFINQDINRYSKLPLLETERLRIGWLGRLDSDKIYSVINLADALIKSNIKGPIDLHIIGDGSAKKALNLSAYTPKIRFIFTSYLIGEDMYEYLKANVDLLVATGISALNGAELGLPVVIPITQNHKFHTNKFVYLFDSEEYSLGWLKEDLKTLNCKTYTIEQIIHALSSSEEKIKLGKKCYEYAKKYHNTLLSVNLLFECINKTTLTVEKCLECSPLSGQLDEFMRIKDKRHLADFEDYINIVKQRNRFSYYGDYEKVKFYIKEIIWERHAKKLLLAFKDILRTRNYRRIQNLYPQKIINIRKRFEKEGTLKVAFIVLYESVFPARPVFEKMLQDKTFDPYVVVSADVQRGIQHQRETYHKCLKFFEAKYPGKVIDGYNEEWDSFIELNDEYPLVFFANPYIKMAHPYHEIRYFLDKDVLTLYINYGFAAVKYGRSIMKLDFYNYVWKVFLDSDINKKDLKKHQPIKARNAVVTSYIKMDELATIKIHERSRKKILICPHHTVLGWKSLDISNFLKYAEVFIELPQLYPEIDFVFRPHQLLFSNLKNSKIWSEDEIQNYLERMLQSPNIQYDVSGDYFETFMNSDAMIHDCSSFIGEYLFTEKPCCYMLKSEEQLKEVFLPMGEMCMKNYYKAYTKDDIIRFIEDVVMHGNDPLKNNREKFSKEVLKFNFPNSADYVVNYIKEQIGV